MLGFLQLCADRRYHRETMDAFEAATALHGPRDYWIEAGAGGAPKFGAATATADFAYAQGARIMGWAAHGSGPGGDGCGGYPGRTDAELRSMLLRTAEERKKDYPEAEHWVLFGEAGSVSGQRI